MHDEGGVGVLFFLFFVHSMENTLGARSVHVVMMGISDPG